MSIASPARGTVANCQDANPFVSVIIPAYDPTAFVPQAVASALGQTWAAREVILINDGASDRDGFERAISHFRTEITYIWQPNGGPGAARNAGLRVARGALVAFLDGDDHWDPDFLREQVAILVADPGLDLVYCDAWICGDSPLAGRRFTDLSPSRGPVTVASLLTCACTVITSAVVARTEAVRAAGGFTASLRRGQDFDLWLRLAQRGARIAYQRKALVYRRLHPQNLSADPIAEHQRVINVLTQPLWSELEAPERALVARRLAYHRGALALVHAKRAIAEGRFDRAREHLTKAAAASRAWKLHAVRLALRVAPGLLRRAYVRRAAPGIRPAAGTTGTPAAPSPPPSSVAAARTVAEPPPAS